MKALELRTLLTNLLSETESATKIADTAERGNRSIGGRGPYADRFHAAVVSVASTEKRIRPHLDGLYLAAEQLTEFDESLAILKGTAGKGTRRVAAQRALRLLCETVILPNADVMTASPRA
jgi:hypothetical protein